jgi:hypothetical protein
VCSEATLPNRRGIGGERRLSRQASLLDPNGHLIPFPQRPCGAVRKLGKDRECRPRNPQVVEQAVEKQAWLQIGTRSQMRWRDFHPRGHLRGPDVPAVDRPLQASRGVPCDVMAIAAEATAWIELSSRHSRTWAGSMRGSGPVDLYCTCSPVVRGSDIFGTCLARHCV